MERMSMMEVPSATVETEAEKSREAAGKAFKWAVDNAARLVGTIGVLAGSAGSSGCGVMVTAPGMTGIERVSVSQAQAKKAEIGTEEDSGGFGSAEVTINIVENHVVVDNRTVDVETEASLEKPDGTFHTPYFDGGYTIELDENGGYIIDVTADVTHGEDFVQEDGEATLTLATRFEKGGAGSTAIFDSYKLVQENGEYGVLFDGKFQKFAGVVPQFGVGESEGCEIVISAAPHLARLAGTQKDDVLHFAPGGSLGSVVQAADEKWGADRTVHLYFDVETGKMTEIGHGAGVSH